MTSCGSLVWHATLHWQFIMLLVNELVFWKVDTFSENTYNNHAQEK